MNAVSLRAALVVLLVGFVTGCGLTLGGAPILSSPENGSTIGCAASGTSYPFAWGAVPNANTYTLEVQQNTPPYTLVASVQVAAPATTASVPDTALTCGTTYRWRVCVVFKDGNPTPTCSGYWTFTIAPAP